LVHSLCRGWWLWMSGVFELCLLPGARLRLGCARRRSGPGLAGGGVGAGTCGVRAGHWGDAGRWARPMVIVVVAVNLGFELQVRRGAFGCGRRCSVVDVALGVLFVVPGL
jgi:hypothetical protein